MVLSLCILKSELTRIYTFTTSSIVSGFSGGVQWWWLLWTGVATYYNHMITMGIIVLVHYIAL